jgi:hypothetical protein
MGSPALRQLALLVGTFLATIAVLAGAWSLLVRPPARAADAQLPMPTLTTVPTPTPPVSAVPTTSSTPTSRAPSPSATSSWAASARPSPLRTPGPTPVPTATPPPGSTTVVEVMVAGDEYVSEEVPDPGRLERLGAGRILLESTRSTPGAVLVRYELDPGALPPGAHVVAADVDVCGTGEGDFWEAYGPDGGDPFEYEVVPPGDHGCWTFVAAPGHDLSVIAAVQGGSRMTVERIVYRVTIAG